MGDKNTNEDLFSGLRELVASSFPKSCNTCGRIFNTAEEEIVYQRHPVHDEFRNNYAHLWEKVVIYDSTTNTQESQ